MKLKTCVIISTIVIVSAGSTVALFDFFYSPITGAVTVNALNGVAAEYGLARFVQNGHFGRLVQWLAAGVLAAVWIPFIFRGSK